MVLALQADYGAKLGALIAMIRDLAPEEKASSVFRAASATIQCLPSVQDLTAMYKAALLKAEEDEKKKSA
jgi:hypothetical protein